MLSVWGAQILIYWILVVGILMYLAVAYRKVRRVQRLILLWGFVAFGLVGVSEIRFATENIVVNIGIAIYLILFTILVCTRARRYLQNDSSAFAVTLSALLSALTLYSLLLEVAWLLPKFGLQESWLSRLYVSWLAWIILGRVSLLLFSLVVLAVEASHRTTETGLNARMVADSFFSHFLAQLRQWADYTFLYTRILGKLIGQALNIVVRLSIRFTIEEVGPAFLVVIAAEGVLWFSRGLFAYLTNTGASALGLMVSALMVTLIIYIFGYLELVCVSAGPEVRWPPVFSSIWPYWYGAVADVMKLAFHLSWLVPLTTVLLFLVHVIFRRFHYDILFPGFGVYFFVFLTLFIGNLFRGYIRDRRAQA